MPNRLQEPFAFVILGASGDLSRRKLIPALFHLANLGYMPERYAVVGFARTPMTDESFRSFVQEALEEHRKDEPTEPPLSGNPLEPFVYYQPGDTTQAESFSALKTRLDELDKKTGLHANRLFYL